MKSTIFAPTNIFTALRQQILDTLWKWENTENGQSALLMEGIRRLGIAQITNPKKTNQHMRIIIIGGVAGGATAAARIRRLTEEAEILLIEKGKYISYANCGLPYYIGGIIKERGKLFVQTPEAFGRRFHIDVRTESEVTKIDTTKKTVTVSTADGRDYTETYDKLLLSPGASPVVPPLPGIDSEGIFTLRNVSDTDSIKAFLDLSLIHI